MLIFPIYEKTMQFDEHVIGMANMMIPPGAEKKEEGRTVGKKAAEGHSEKRNSQGEAIPVMMPDALASGAIETCTVYTHLFLRSEVLIHNLFLMVSLVVNL